MNPFHHRLSKIAGAKLTHGNAAITDLSDTDRPTKLAEKFSELYDNAWTDAFEELDNTFHNEEETIKILLRIFQVNLLSFMYINKKKLEKKRKLNILKMLFC